MRLHPNRDSGASYSQDHKQNLCQRRLAVLLPACPSTRYGLRERLPGGYEDESFIELLGIGAADRALGHRELVLGRGQ